MPPQEPQIPQEPHHIQPTTPPSHRKKYLIIGGITLFILFIVSSNVIYYLTSQNKSTPSTTTISPSKSLTQLTPVATLTPKVFKTRYFDITSYFWDFDAYPAELTQKTDTSLIPISCTELYSGYGNDYTSYDTTTQKSIPLTNTSIKNYIQDLKGKYKNTSTPEVREILTCSPENGDTILLYSLGPCGGGCSGIPYVGIANNSDIQEVQEISRSGAAYFGCRQPLQLTNENIFYFSCGGGDGPRHSRSLHKLSLDAQNVTTIKECNAGVDENGTPYSECE